MMIDRNSKRLALLLAASFLPTLAHAQTAFEPTESTDASTTSDGLGEIIVTANRREESAQKVGIAIAALSGETLSELNLTSSTDIARFAPGVTATGAQGGFLQTFSIRGVTQNDYNPHQEGPVAAYIDDVYISSIQGQAFALFDSSRVEILKGPQGTLFGRNATGGLVHYVSNKPSTDRLSGYVGASYGRYNALQIDGAINLPLSDKAAVRVAGIFSRHDPILKNQIGPDQWDGRMGAGRIHLLLEPTDDLRMLLSARYGRTSTTISVGNQYPAAIPIFDAGGVQIDEVLAPGAGPSSITRDPLVGQPVTVTTSIGQDRNFSEAYGFTSNNEVTSGDITINAIADYSHFKWRVGSSLSGSFPFGFDTYAKGIDQFSGELRVSGDHGSLRWVVGGYYLDVKSESGSAFGDVGGFIFPGATAPSDQTFVFNQKTKSLSGFGQAEFDLTSRLTAIAGIRFIRERKDYDYVTRFGVTLTDPGILLSEFNSTVNPTLVPRTQNLSSWKLGLNYRATDDILLYATVNRGVKAGGYNAPSAPLAASFMIFEPETLYAYEGGFKSTLLDRRLLLNGSVFYYDYAGYQAYATVGTVNYVFNGKARNVGAELQLTANPVEGLNLSLSGSVMNAKVKDAPLGGVTKDRKPAFSPDFQLSALARYEVPVSFGKVWGQVDGSYTSSYFVQLNNFTSMQNKAYALVNLRIGVGSDAETGWSLTASVVNVTDKRYITSGFATGRDFGADINAYNMPRTWQIAARYAF